MKYLGDFTLPHSDTFVGELSVQGRHTILAVHSEKAIPDLPPECVISGLAYSGKTLTLIDCISYRNNRKTIHGSAGDVHRHQLSAYVNHVVIGPRRLDPQAKIVSRIEFSTNDLNAVFFDPTAFGIVPAAGRVIDTVLEERRKHQEVPSGVDALAAYYSGRSIVIAIRTTIGTISVEHKPSFGGGGAGSGVRIKDHLALCIEPAAPIRFWDVLEHVHDIATFLSFAAGRCQRLRRVRIVTNEVSGPIPDTYEVRSRYRWKDRGPSSERKPYWKDLPLDPVNRAGEFTAVLANWLKNRNERRVARARYIDGLRKENDYGYDRLVAAANMFDLLPKDAVPTETGLDQNLQQARKECVLALKKLPDGPDRNSALSALGRIGKPSLPKKVEHRLAMVIAKVGPHFPDLGLVAKYAVKCRNAFVHGNTDEFDLATLEKFVPFLTETLEFIFATSDFIESGWDAAAWASRPFMAAHSFTRYRWMYRQLQPLFKAALAKSKSDGTGT